MNKRFGSGVAEGSKVWVWDSFWLPAVVVRFDPNACLVRLDHGVTFSVNPSDVQTRDPESPAAPSARTGRPIVRL